MQELQSFGDYETAFKELMQLVPVDQPFVASLARRDVLKPMTSALVGDFVHAISLTNPTKAGDRQVAIKKDKLIEVTILKELTWNYVILSPLLATQQHGYRTIIKGLFDIYANAVTHGEKEIIPTWFEFDDEAKKDDETTGRIAADIVSSFTDGQALVYYRRLNGISPGSLRDFI